MEQIDTPPYCMQHIRTVFISTALVLCSLIALLLLVMSQPPRLFAEANTLVVAEGMTVRDIAHEAEKNHLVRSSFLLYALLTLAYEPTSIYAGTYTFANPVSVFQVAATVAAGSIEDESVRVTIPEGTRVHEVALIINRVLPNLSTTTYEHLALEKEGYIFPETYFIPPYFTEADIFSLQLATYEAYVSPLREQISASGFSEYEVLTLASIIEREANDATSMKMVSGIFQNRLAIGMALQADASIEYTLATPLNELKAGELAQNLRTLDSPYNTYLYPGLPPTPIGNPGLAAIMAVLEPTPSEYFFYLTDENGDFYYAKTLREHNNNIKKYLQ